MPTTMLTDSYGWVTPNQYRAYRAHNISPSDADTWHDCFEARGRAPQGDTIAAWVTLTARIGLTGDRAAWWADKWRGCSYTAAETAGLVVAVLGKRRVEAEAPAAAMRSNEGVCFEVDTEPEELRDSVKVGDRFLGHRASLSWCRC